MKLAKSGGLVVVGLLALPVIGCVGEHGEQPLVPENSRTGRLHIPVGGSLDRDRYNRRSRYWKKPVIATQSWDGRSTVESESKLRWHCGLRQQMGNRHEWGPSN